ncbi:MAG: type I polyketide synthase [Desulfobacterales bacterium]|nr:type I polyketide synthase [Desulfobacterales bacterium]
MINQDRQKEDIAIIGMGCRFPGESNSPDSYWKLLENGVDATKEVPPERWNNRELYDPDREKEGKLITKWGAFINNIDQFDPYFFGISPREASYIDPQQRLLLEVTWEALENGGQKIRELAGRDVGVFIGAFTLDYKLLQFMDPRFKGFTSHTSTGVMMTMASNRISYTFDFRGPSISVDTACSSSLVAVHLACESLRRGESSLAIAGGAMLMIMPQYTIVETKGGFLSPDGRCKAFDSRANGYVRGEGVGVVVLKPLAKALADNDPVEAVILGSAINQDGHTTGITVPDQDAQESVIMKACNKAGVSPGQIQYVEAHGTGTPAGDPVEAKALGRVLAIGRARGDKCIIGSCKTNIGHTEAAAGVAGLIKAVLCLKHKRIPKHLHFFEPNPEIPFDSLCLRIPGKIEPWPSHNGPALAGVNSFGFGGTNVHVVLREAPQNYIEDTGDTEVSARPFLLPISGTRPEALRDIGLAYREFLYNNKYESVQDYMNLCYSASLRRDHHEYRQAIVFSSKTDLIEKLSASVNGESSPGITPVITPGITSYNKAARAQKLVWVYPGMGAQWWSMGRELLEKEPVFHGVIDQCNEILGQYADWSLTEELTRDEGDSRLDETRISQPANFAVQAGLSALWRSWGIKPDAVIGHSAGEVAACYASGVYSLEQAVKVIFHRSRLQQTLRGKGKMLAVNIPEQEANDFLREYGNRIAVAAVNSPGSVTLSGEDEALEEIAGEMEDKGIFCRFLHVDIPFHSHYMDSIINPLLNALSDISPRPPSIPFYSTVTGKPADNTGIDAHYWCRNVREPVRFASAISGIIEDGYSVFLEIGPHPVLSTHICENLEKADKEGMVIPSVKRRESEQERMLTSLGELYATGFQVDWNVLYPKARFVAIPTCPWQRETFWAETKEVRSIRIRESDHPLLGRRLSASIPTWEVEISLMALPYLKDHYIMGRILYPGAGFVEMALGALSILAGYGHFSIRDLEFRKAINLSEDTSQRVQIFLDMEEALFKILALSDDEYDEYNPMDILTSGIVSQIQDTSSLRNMDSKDIKDRCTWELSGDQCYRYLNRMGFEYGPLFQGINRLYCGYNEAFAEIRLPDSIHTKEDSYYFHPGILDSCFQTIIAAVFSDRRNKGKLQDFHQIPVKIKELRFYGRPAGKLWAHARLSEKDQKSTRGDILIYNENGLLIAEIIGFITRSLDSADGQASLKSMSGWFYELEWQKTASIEKQRMDREYKDKDGAWIIFSDTRGIGESLGKIMEKNGLSCTFVSPGREYRVSQDKQRYEIRPSVYQDYLSLLEDAGCQGIIHLWNLEAPSSDEISVLSLEDAKILGCNSMVCLVRAIAEADVSPRVWSVTRGAQVTGHENLNKSSIAQAPAWGLGRVLGQQEFIENWGGSIDLDPDRGFNEASTLCDIIMNPDTEDQVAIRGKTLYVPRINKFKSVIPPLKARFRSDGTYIVTGAFGGLGKSVTRMLVNHGARRLILMGRTQIPERSAWDHIEEKSLAERISFIRELEETGAILYSACIDVADEDQFSSFYKEFKGQGWPSVRGIIHTAGVARDVRIHNMDDQAFDEAYRPKVSGAWLLHRFFREDPLDFFILFSSVGSLITSTGQANYAAGNAFLDALAIYRRSEGLPGLSINWGPWTAGMAKKNDLVKYFKESGLDCITPSQGTRALLHLTGQDISQVMVCPADWAQIARRYSAVPHMFAHLTVEDEKKELVKYKDKRVLLENFLQTPPSEQHGFIREYIMDIAVSVMDCRRSLLELDKPMVKLGLDSMMAAKFQVRIESDLGLRTDLAYLLGGASISKLTGRMLLKLRDSY